MKLGILCDAANATANGKLNILGEFNTIHSPEAPVGWPLFTIVIRVEAPTVEGSEHHLEIDLTTEDGQSILNERPGGPIQLKPQGPGRPLRGQLIAQVGGMQFPQFGDYEFHILVDNRVVGTIPVYIVQIQPGQAGPGAPEHAHGPVVPGG